jgi:hypothetical protein
MDVDKSQPSELAIDDFEHVFCSGDRMLEQTALIQVFSISDLASLF